MGERTSRQAISQLAATLFQKKAAEPVIVAALPRQRAAMHLDTVFTFADRDCVLLYPDIVDSIQVFSYRPANTPSGLELRKDDKPFVDGVAEALGLKKLRVSKPAEMRTCVSARNGTAAPTSSARHPAWSSLITATPLPIHWSARRASRSPRFRVPSSGAAAMAGTA
jgi:arginine deiminase